MLGELQAVGQRLRLGGDHKGGRRVEYGDIAIGALAAFEDRLEGRRIGCGVTAAQCVGFDAGNAQALRHDLERPHAPVLQRRHGGRPCGGDLVEAVGAVHHISAVGAEVLEHVGERLDPLARKHPDHLAFHAGRVRQRPQQVEDGSGAELDACRADMLHGRMMCRREHESDPGGLDTGTDRFRRDIYLDTKGGEDVGGAGSRRQGTVAEHGNRALSSRSGAADVLTALGVKIDIPPKTITACIKTAGIGFMFAPAHHPAMKHVGPTRVELGTRTIFNLLGPLSNPAGVKRQMVGVFSRQWVEPLAHVLKNLGSDRAYVVHGSDGLDEITTAGPTAVAALEHGSVRTFEIVPESLGIARVKPDALRGGDAATNAAALKAVLEGRKSAYRDVAVLNAAAALVVAAKAETLADGLKLAQHAIDSGGAEGSLDRLIAVSNG